jgi:hypothetical protein
MSSIPLPLPVPAVEKDRYACYGQADTKAPIAIEEYPCGDQKDNKKRCEACIHILYFRNLRATQIVSPGQVRDLLREAVMKLKNLDYLTWTILFVVGWMIHVPESSDVGLSLVFASVVLFIWSYRQRRREPLV